jgi:hypothetical protein
MTDTLRSAGISPSQEDAGVRDVQEIALKPSKGEIFKQTE